MSATTFRDHAEAHGAVHHAGVHLRRSRSEPALALMTERRNISPRRLVEPGPSREEVGTLMEAAVTAPDHGTLTPWRFILIPDAARPGLGHAFAKALVERDPGATQEQLETAVEKAHRAPCLLVAVLRRDNGTSGIPDAERLVSLGCAIQNALLAATAMGYGSGLTSGRSLSSTAMRSYLGLQPDEQAVCFLAVGTKSVIKAARVRPLAETVLHTLTA